jgi:hypothetical protein
MDGVTKSEGVTPEESRNPSRGTSLLGAGGELDGLGQSWKAERRVVGDEEVKVEKERGALRASFVFPFSTSIFYLLILRKGNFEMP